VVVTNRSEAAAAPVRKTALPAAERAQLGPVRSLLPGCYDRLRRLVRPLRGRLGVLLIEGGLAMQIRRVVVTRRTLQGCGLYASLEAHTLTVRVWVMVWQV